MVKDVLNGGPVGVFFDPDWPLQGPEFIACLKWVVFFGVVEPSKIIFLI